MDKCRTNGGTIRKVNCKKKKRRTPEGLKRYKYLDPKTMTCCCHVECDPIEKAAKQLIKEFSMVW